MFFSKKMATGWYFSQLNIIFTTYLLNGIIKFISMKIKLLALLCAVLLSAFSVKAQLDTQLLMYVDSTEIILNNGRRVVYQSLSEGNYSKASEVYEYLIQEADKRHCYAFSLNEDLYINLLLTNWNNWFSIAKTYNEQVSKTACYNFSENYVERLFKLTLRHQQRIENEFNNQSLLVDEFDLFRLFMQLLQQDEINQLYIARYNSFQKMYPNSDYIHFVKGYFPKPPVKSAFSMGLGPTFITSTGKLREVFSPGTLVNLTMDVNIGKVYSGLHIDAGLMNLQIPIEFRNSMGQTVKRFNAGESFSFMGGGIYAGYYIVRSNHFQLAPFLNVGGYTFESNLYNDYDESENSEYQIFDSFVAGPGIHAELRLTEFTLDPYYGAIPGMETKSYLSLKMDVGYDFVTQKVGPDFKGNLPYLRLGLIWGIGNF